MQMRSRLLTDDGLGVEKLLGFIVSFFVVGEAVTGARVGSCCSRFELSDYLLTQGLQVFDRFDMGT